MLRVVLVALALVLAANCAHAQDRPEDAVAARAVAGVILAAMPEERYASWGYGWGPMSSRVSPLVHWHIYGPDRPAPASSDIVERNGWIAGEGYSLQVTVRGVEAQVIEISIDANRFSSETLLDVLRVQGATISFEGDDESSMYYWVVTPGRTGARLALTRTCTSPNSAAMQRCTNTASVQFDIQEAAPSSP